MTNKKDPFAISDLDASLPAAAAALRPEDRAELVNALKNKLQDLAGKHSDILENLPPQVRKRVEFLKHIQSQYDELETKFFEERKALEAKYQNLYEPLYTKRYEIVNGIKEVEGVASDTAMDQEEYEAAKEKGVPDFWLTAMKTNEVLAEEITERDEGALKFLKDIKWHRLDDPEGFKLEFYFDPNPYFKNSVLTKTYHMINDDDDPILEKAIGAEIEWYPGKCLTQKVLRKKPRKGSKNPNPIVKIENCQSFFTFFNPPHIPEEEDDLDDDTAEELQDRMEQDYNTGIIIREKIIPHAVRWFLGEVDGVDDNNDSDDEYDESEEMDDNDEDEEEDEDEAEEEDKNGRKKPFGRPERSRGAKAGGGQQGEYPSECKQQ